MSLVFADSFYFFALLNARDEAHGRASEFSRTFRGRLITTAWVFTEVADGFAWSARRLLVPAFFRAFEAEKRHIFIPPTLSLYREGIAAYEQHRDKGWSLTDCISFTIMRRQGINEALTGDRHFQEAGFVALLSPAE